jgi:dTDP-4-amino-4,6-dideoxygalactose transaminase
MGFRHGGAVYQSAVTPQGDGSLCALEASAIVTLLTHPPASSGSSLAPIPLSLPWIDEREFERVRQALAGRVAGDGPFGRRVEQRLAALLGIDHVLLTTSCTHALELGLLALGLGPGDEVLCPAFTFTSTANAILRVGAQPVLCDIEPVTLGLDPEQAEARATDRCRALLPVHYGGLACEMGPLLDLARTRELRVLEDAAQGFNASYRGQPLGTLADAGALSFHETKNITCGEGGALVLRDAAVAARAEVLREKGTNRRAFLRGEVDRYTWIAAGSSYVLADVLAAMLDAQLDKAAEIQARRAAVATRYRSALGPWAARHGVRLPAEPHERETNHHAFFLIFPEPASRERALVELRARGVLAASHYEPLHSSPFGASLPGARGAFPVTERISSSILRLPMHPQLGPAEIERVIAAVLDLTP